MKQASHRTQPEEHSTLSGMHMLLHIYLFFDRTVLQVFLYPLVTYYWLINRSGRHERVSLI